MNVFWAREETDRPLVLIGFRKPGAGAFAHKKHPSWQERWLDLEYRTLQTVHHMENTVFYADMMPVAWPNLGPGIFSAWAGCPYEYGADTTWTSPCIEDWDKDAGKAVVDMSHPLLKKTEEFTRMLLEQAGGKFIVGLTDFHPGGDHLAALRDSEQLAIDLIDNPDAVKAKLETSYTEYFRVYDYFAGILKENQMPISTWLTLTSETTMYVPSNDFSCMISESMFEEFFLEGIRRECRHYENNIYHLDGPGALRHLDMLLSLDELDAVQWVPGAGNDEALKWLDVYDRVLSKGKGLYICNVRPTDLDTLMEHLPARGVCLHMNGINDGDTAAAVMRKIEKWPMRRN